MLRPRKVLFLLFFLSGFCGLLYQVVWVRMSFASFGVITPVLSVVISVFMAGLFLGSWLAGRVVGPLAARTGASAIRFYALAELCVAAGAFAVPVLLGAGESWLLTAGETRSAGYLFWSALVIAGAIFPWCVFMGATFPLMMAFVKEEGGEETSFSFLYLANVVGAMVGVLATALALVELLGFSGTLRVGAATNLLVAAVAASLRVQRRAAGGDVISPEPGAPAAATPGGDLRFARAILFTTGFASMAMEVAWTRGFTAVLHTQVYSFAALLFTYLLATWLGSLQYRRHLARQRVVTTARLVAWLALGAALPIVLNDPRLFPSVVRAAGEDVADVIQVAAVLLSIVPFCAVLGYLTPRLVDGCSRGKPEAAGIAYAINVLGCIAGPLVASYLLLPLLGIKGTLLLLAAPFAVLLALFAGGLPGTGRRDAVAAVALLGVAAVVCQTYEDRVQGYHGQGLLRRDHTATVISYGEGMDRRLLVNGVGMTHLSTITKVMAHLPLGLLRQPPRSALAVCFGMGTTFRSLMSWDVRTTAVELVPSVKEAFPYFFADAAEVMARPNGRVVIDDGRRFLRRTGEAFDVITLDPPPPVEAAASSLLYSTEFYAAARARLAPGGILQQWVPQAEDRIARAVARSLIDSFPHVRMYGSCEGWGYHFLASMEPIEVPAAAVLAARLPPRARQDLVEWVEPKDPARLLGTVLAAERDPRLFARGEGARISDDHPFNEYYLIRRALRHARELAAPAGRQRGRGDG